MVALGGESASGRIRSAKARLKMAAPVAAGRALPVDSYRRYASVAPLSYRPWCKWATSPAVSAAGAAAICGEHGELVRRQRYCSR